MAISAFEQGPCSDADVGGALEADIDAEHGAGGGGDFDGIVARERRIAHACNPLDGASADQLLDHRSANSSALLLKQDPATELGQAHQLGELLVTERALLAGGLQLDHPAIAGK